MKKCSLFFLLLLAFCFTGCAEKSYLDTEEAFVSPETETDEEPEPKEPEEAFVYVCGEVEVPGVYEVTTESRVYEVIALAGGLTEEADTAAVNQAEAVYDGMMITVPAAGEEPSSSGQASDGRVNINTASREEILTLPGIGESKADSILSYREEHGRFSAPEDLMQIPGIKEGVFGKLKDKIKV